MMCPKLAHCDLSPLQGRLVQVTTIDLKDEINLTVSLTDDLENFSKLTASVRDARRTPNLVYS